MPAVRSASAAAILLARGCIATVSPLPSLRRCSAGARGFGCAYYVGGVIVAAAHPALRALAGAARRPVAARRGVLHHERHHQPHVLRLRAGRAARATRRAIARTMTAADDATCRSSSRSPARRARRTPCGCSRCSLAAEQPRELIVSAHGLRLLAARRSTSDSSGAALRERVGGGDGMRCVTVFDDRDRGAAPASGSARNAGMVICPCSMGTLSRDQPRARRARWWSARRTWRSRSGGSSMLVPRETPLSAIHLENMLRLTRAGAVVLPAAPGFYHRPHDASRSWWTSSSRGCSITRRGARARHAVGREPDANERDSRTWSD